MSKRAAYERFWSKVDKHGPYTGLVAGRCWLWTAAVNKDGYGKFGLEGRWVRAYKWAWEQEHGPVPAGRELDHRCQRPACIRTSHLRVVTHRRNVLDGNGWAGRNARKTHCRRGHRLAGSNLRILRGGSRRCLQCERDNRPKRKAA